MKNGLVGNVTEYKLPIFIILAVVIGFKVLQYKYRNHQLQLVKIDIIYQEVINKLVTQLKVSKNDPRVKPYVGSNQLRDLILSNEHNLGERLRLWNIVSDKVDNNTNIVTNIVEEYGEIMKVWQWINEIDLDVL